MSEQRRVPRNKCWAEGYECSGKIEKEHVISNGILRELGPFKYKIGSKEIILGSGSYVTTSLCAKHNRELRNIDAEAIKFFSAWSNLPRSPSNSSLLEFDGLKIEKWFAKTTVNSIIFRNQAFVKHSAPPLFPSFEQIKGVLFGGDKCFKHPYGLYTKWPEHKRFHVTHNEMKLLLRKSFLIMPDTGKVKEIEIPFGFSATFFGFTLMSFFNLSMYPDTDAPNSMPTYSLVSNELSNLKYRNFHVAAGGSEYKTAGRLRLVF